MLIRNHSPTEKGPDPNRPDQFRMLALSKAGGVEDSLNDYSLSAKLKSELLMFWSPMNILGTVTDVTSHTKQMRSTIRKQIPKT